MRATKIFTLVIGFALIGITPVASLNTAGVIPDIKTCTLEPEHPLAISLVGSVGTVALMTSSSCTD